MEGASGEKSEFRLDIVIERYSYTNAAFPKDASFWLKQKPKRSTLIRYWKCREKTEGNRMACS